jgi:hypothetical protein
MSPLSSAGVKSRRTSIWDRIPAPHRLLWSGRSGRPQRTYVRPPRDLRPRRADHATRTGVRAMVFVAIGVAGVALVTTTDAWWTAALACAGVAFALTGVLVTGSQVADCQSDAEPGGRGRAIACGRRDSDAGPGRDAPAPVAQAQDAVQGFGTAAVIQPRLPLEGASKAWDPPARPGPWHRCNTRAVRIARCSARFACAIFAVSPTRGQFPCDH